MSNLNNRLDRLEKDGGGDDLPWRALKQDRDDIDLYRAADGTEYRRGEWGELEGQYNLILVNYDRTGPPEPGEIRLDWGED